MVEPTPTDGGSNEDAGPFVDWPEGTYAVDDDGHVRSVPNWQPAVNKVPWERLDAIVDAWLKGGSSERKFNLNWMYVLTGLAVVGAIFLAWAGILEGQALAGFLGTVIGYLLSRGTPRPTSR